MVDNTPNKSDIFSYKSVFQKTGLSIIYYIRQKFLYAVCYGFSCDLVVAIEKSYSYYINTNEISGELSRENLISSCVKITCYLHM